ncbi:MAG: DUF3224 domain-containing protein [Acidimicrobiales bacterium]
MAIATGTFEVNMEPMGGSAAEGGDAVTRFALDKTYAGDLIGSAAGQMLASTTAVDGSAGYVAIERIVGSLGDASGSFVIQHFGLMNRGDPSLDIAIIPDSGTEGLTGISGQMSIDVDAEGNHVYQLDYQLP